MDSFQFPSRAEGKCYIEKQGFKVREPYGGVYGNDGIGRVGVLSYDGIFFFGMVAWSSVKEDRKRLGTAFESYIPSDSAPADACPPL